MNDPNLNEEALAHNIDQLFSEYDAETHGYLRIGIIGKVSSGKSSFLNAFFDCPKSNPSFPVGAVSGVTTNTDRRSIGDRIIIWDTPGLQDYNDSNISKTKELLKEGIDIGILILEGSADAQQQENYKKLKEKTEYVFVILNKIDQYSQANLKEIITQWEKVLKLEDDKIIYPVCTRGYDPKDKIIDPETLEEKEIPVNDYGVPKTVKGINEVKNQVFEACFKVGKIAFIARAIKRKQPQAMAIIAAACVTSVGAVFLPGSIAIIGANQAGAISSLGYLYKGEFPSKQEITQIMKTFSTTSALSLGAIAYGIFISFLPPTGILDIGGIVLVVAYMATTLLIINYCFSKGVEIEKSAALTQEFNRINKELYGSIANADIREIGRMNFWIQLLEQINVNIGSPVSLDDASSGQ
jgi:small GTP-binding protein